MSIWNNNTKNKAVIVLTKWWNLRGENLVKDKVLEKGNQLVEENTNVMWNKMSNIITRKTKNIWRIKRVQG